jgi:Holliday junction DNA helicase RuvA
VDQFGEAGLLEVIAHLRGKILSAKVTDSVRVVVEAGNGVGYEVFAPLSSGGLRLGEEASFWTAHIVREDSQTLYGFESESDCDLFKVLIGVSGVGPKIALAMLSSLGAAQIEAAVEAGDIKLLSTTPGVGAKMASKIVLDVKGKLVEPEQAAAGKLRTNQLNPLQKKLLAALQELGFRAADFPNALEYVEQQLGTLTAEEQLPDALKLVLARR